MEQISLKSFYTSRQDQIAVIIKAILGRELESVRDDDWDFWKDIDPILEIGEFDNCREYGFTYSILGGVQDMVFCVYEHRNSDQIIINGCKRQDVKPYGPYNGTNKYDYLANFSYDQYAEAAEQLAKFLTQSYKGEFNESLLKDVE